MIFIQFIRNDLFRNCENSSHQNSNEFDQISVENSNDDNPSFLSFCELLNVDISLNSKDYPLFFDFANGLNTFDEIQSNQEISNDDGFNDYIKTPQDIIEPECTEKNHFDDLTPSNTYQNEIVPRFSSISSYCNYDIDDFPFFDSDFQMKNSTINNYDINARYIDLDFSQKSIEDNSHIKPVHEQSSTFSDISTIAMDELASLLPNVMQTTHENVFSNAIETQLDLLVNNPYESVNAKSQILTDGLEQINSVSDVVLAQSSEEFVGKIIKKSKLNSKKIQKSNNTTKSLKIIKKKRHKNNNIFRNNKSNKNRLLFKKIEHNPESSSYVKLTFKIDEPQEETINNDTLFKLIHETIDFHSQFMKMISNSKIDYDNFFTYNDLIKLIDRKINNIKQEIESETKNSKTYRTQLRLLTFQKKGFCIFCSENACFNSDLDTNYSYKQQVQNLYAENTDFVIWGDLCTVFLNIEKLSDSLQVSDLYSFFRYFENLRNELDKIIEQKQELKLYLNINQKKELMKIILHDFKFKNSELKILLIPEFYSILFLIVNCASVFHNCTDNFKFFSFYFYLRSFELFLNFISRKKNNFVTNIIGHEKQLDKKKRILVSFLIRINFVQPLIILITKNQKILNRHQFHILSLFKIECENLRTGECDTQMMNFLKINIWWICCLNRNMNSTQFLNYYRMKNIDFFMFANKTFFKTFASLMDELKTLQSSILSDSLINQENMIDLKNFLHVCQTLSNFTQYQVRQFEMKILQK